MSKMIVTRVFRVKAYEIDAMGIMSNINYIRWFEDMRHDFLDVYYPYGEMMQAGISPVLMRTEVDYKRPIIITDEAVGTCKISKMDNKRWEMELEIKVGDKVCCLGVQRGCFFDLNKKRPTRVPAKLQEAYAQALKEESVKLDGV